MDANINPGTSQSAFPCDLCDASYKFKHHLNAHKKEKHGEYEGKSSVCPMCWTPVESNIFMQHLIEDHAINVQVETKEFPNFSDFLVWKDSIEKDTLSKYKTKRGAYTKNVCRTHYFICFRSGFFKSESKGLRRLKTRGSCKINALCPASIVVKEDLKSGKCVITFNKTHLHESEIRLLTPTAAKKDMIALKVPFDSILDDVRDSICSNKLESIHLLTKKNLLDLERSFNLGSEAVKHRNDLLSLESWIQEMREDCVLFYKPQGVDNEMYPSLKKDDFLLIIMNKAQAEMLQKYASDSVCMDSTHGLNSYGFDLTTLLVIDDLRQGFPCSFLISNRTDKEVLSVFFLEVKKVTGLLSPNIFMSDMAKHFYNAWTTVMNIPELRLYCAWHVDRAWRNNLKRIKGKDKQVHTYKQLRTLLQESDVNAFLHMMSEAHKNWLDDSDTEKFAMYFGQFYLGCAKSWAYCYRQHVGLNTNMHLERMHKTLKYIYLQGKKVKRLDKTIHAIMRFVRDKLVDCLIVLCKGKISNKIKELRKRHRTSEAAFSDTIITKEGEKWNVQSSKGADLYSVEEIKTGCSCEIICVECNSCIHHYICSCIDSSIKWNMCKHIHLVCRFRKSNENSEAEETDMEDSTSLCIAENPKTDEMECIMETLSSKKSNIQEPLDKYKEDMKTSFMKMLDSVSSVEEAKVMNKVLVSMGPALSAVRSSRKIEAESSSKRQPANKNIETQRRLFSTKKTRTFKKSFTKPTINESMKVAASLMLSNIKKNSEE